MPLHGRDDTSRPSKQSQKSTQDLDGESRFLETIRTDPSLIHLDGCTLEGGGQLVRVALALSALTSVPIHIYRIRGNRSGRSSGRSGGLKSSHLAAFEFLATATGAKTWGGYVGSTEIVFEPGKDEQILGDRVRNKNGGAKVGDAYEIRLDKPGSVWLILQAILPYMLFAASENVPTRLTMSGGTNVPMSMSGEYVKQVMCPMFERIGLPRVTVDIRTRGWTHGRALQIGQVDVRVYPLGTGAKIPAFEFRERGAISNIAISVLAGTEAMRMALVEQATTQIRDRYPGLPPAEVVVNEDSGDPKRLYILLVAHTSNGYRLGRDWLYDEKIKGSLKASHTEPMAKKMVQKVVDDLAVEIAQGGCVDEYLRDQLVVFETLADGRSHVNGGGDTREVSLHTRTCRWVAEQILAEQARFDAAGACTGVGFSAGEVFARRKGLIMQTTAELDPEEDRRSGSMEGRDQVGDGALVKGAGKL